MARPVTLMSIQWSDLSLEEMCKLGAEMGYEGLELAPGADENAVFDVLEAIGVFV